MNGRIAEYISEHSDIPPAYGYQGSSLQMLIDEIIAQAVQAEREACAKVADAIGSGAAYRIQHYAVTPEAKQQRIAQMDAANTIAAAIRARNGAGRK